MNENAVYDASDRSGAFGMGVTVSTVYYAQHKPLEPRELSRMKKLWYGAVEIVLAIMLVAPVVAIVYLFVKGWL